MGTNTWPTPTNALLRAARTGDAEAIGQVLMVYRGQLKRVVRARLDPRLAGRLDDSDVVSDVYTAAFESVPTWLSEEKPLFACLHTMVRSRLAKIHRDQIGAEKRSVQLERGYNGLSNDSVLHICRRIGTRHESPSQPIVRAEVRSHVRQCIERMSEIDREVLIMRAIEQTPAREVASALGLTESAAKMRYYRALERLRSEVEGLDWSG